MGCGCWQDLPSDLVRSLAEALSGVDDLVRLGAVCRPWSEALTAGFRPVYFPWLLLTSRFSLKEVPFYCPNNYRVNRFPLPAPLTGDSSRVVGCHHGWLVAVDDKLHDVLIFNPVTGDRANLPSFSCLLNARRSSFHLIKKVALSSVPSAAAANDIVAAAVYQSDYGGSAIAFARVGDDTWSGSVTLHLSTVMDVIYYRGNFFVLSFEGQYRIINPSSGGGAMQYSSIVPLSLHDDSNRCVYFKLVLSPSSGHLLVVGRVAPRSQSSTIGRRLVVRKFDPDADSSSASRWVEIKDLGDESLFFSTFHSMLLPVCSSSRMIRRNCIYFIYRNAILPSQYLYAQKKISSSTVELFDLEKGVFGPSPLVEQQSWMRNWKKSLIWIEFPPIHFSIKETSGS